MGSESNSSGLNEAVAVGRTAAHTARTAAQIGKSIASGASKGGIWGAVAGAAWGARKHIGRALAVIVVLLMLPIMFILMLPAIAFDGLKNALTVDSSEVILNSSIAVTQNLTNAANAISQVLGEGIDDVTTRIGQHFATTGGDYYEIINPYEENLISNANMFISEYCAAKDTDWQSISINDMAATIRAGKSHLYSYTFKTELREVVADDPETEDVVETTTELWYVYSIVYQGETYFADTIFHLTDEQKALARDYAENLNLFLFGSSSASGAPMVVPDGYGTAAGWIQSHIDANGNLDETARLTLFGSASKTHFSSSEEAAPYMTSIKIPVWKIDNTGAKYATTAWLTVHSLLANDVQAIFEEIYNDPEHFPINAVGGARFTDTLRHSWGCAIDINPEQNCECNFHSGYQALTCGYGWWPEGLADSTEWVGRVSSSYHGSLSGPSAYSIKPGGSVVRAFAKYGWGWGGNGWYGGKGFDFMHFSVLSSGG